MVAVDLQSCKFSGRLTAVYGDCVYRVFLTIGIADIHTIFVRIPRSTADLLGNMSPHTSQQLALGVSDLLNANSPFSIDSQKYELIRI